MTVQHALPARDATFCVEYKFGLRTHRNRENRTPPLEASALENKAIYTGDLQHTTAELSDAESALEVTKSTCVTMGQDPAVDVRDEAYNYI